MLTMNVNKNRYYKHSRITEAKFRQILRCFALDLTATETAELTGISVRSVNSIFLKIRKRITATSEIQSPFPSDNESRGSLLGNDKSDPINQYLVFGIYRQQDQVYTEIAPACTRKYIQQSHRNGNKIAGLSDSEGWKNYDGLVDVQRARLFRMQSLDLESGEVSNTINQSLAGRTALLKLLPFNTSEIQNQPMRLVCRPFGSKHLDKCCVGPRFMR